MITLITVVHVAICLFLIVIILLQHGKGADVGATFGGSGQSLFGSEGPLPLMNKITTTVAILFMLTSVSLAYFSSSKSTGTVMSDLPKPKAAVVEKVEAKVEKEEKIVPMPVAAPESQEGVPAAENKKPVSAPESQITAPVSTEGTATENKEKK
ncbi:MAG: preprotein translocase subunit SecG [Desulfobulbaceae bacterium]